MPKISKNRLEKTVYDAILRQLIVAFKQCLNEKTLEDLFDSLFTKTERLMFAKRLAIAVLLERGLNYKDISRLIKVSSVTIGLVRNNIMKNNQPYLDLVKSLVKILKSF